MHTRKSLILFIFLFLTLLKLFSPFVRIAETSCLIGNQVCPDSLKSLVEETKGLFFFQVDKRKLATTLENTGMIQDPIIHISPKKIEVIMSKTVERVTINVIFESQGPQFNPISLKEFLATQSAKRMSVNIKGILEESTQDSNYYFLGSQIPKREVLFSIRRWVDSLKNYSKNDYPTLFTDQEVIYSPIDKLLAIFNINKSPDEELALMGKLLGQAKSKGSTILDFRYNNP